MIFNARQGFCMRNLNIIHHSKQSLYFINSTPLSITNNLHCPSIKRATSMSYLYRSPPVHNTAGTKISFWTISHRIAQYMVLTLHLFYIKNLIVDQRFCAMNLNLLHCSKQPLCFVNSTPLDRIDCYRL